MQLTARFRDAHTSLFHRRAVRLADRRLSAKLATFSTVADCVELDHLLERHGAEETPEIREIPQPAARRTAIRLTGSPT